MTGKTMSTITKRNRSAARNKGGKERRKSSNAVRVKNSMKLEDILKSLPSETCVLLKAFQNSLTNFICPKCHKGYKNLKYGLKHVIYCANSNFERSILVECNRVIYVCTICHFNCTEISDIANHRTNCKSKSNKELLFNYNDIKKNYACTTCGFSCLSSQTYENHSCTKNLLKMTCSVKVERINPNKICIRNGIILNPVACETLDKSALDQDAPSKINTCPTVSNKDACKIDSSTTFPVSSDPCISNNAGFSSPDHVASELGLNSSSSTLNNLTDSLIQNVLSVFPDRYKNMFLELTKVFFEDLNDDEDGLTELNSQGNDKLNLLKNLKCQCENRISDSNEEDGHCFQCFRAFIEKNICPDYAKAFEMQDSAQGISATNTAQASESTAVKEIGVSTTSSPPTCSFSECDIAVKEEVVDPEYVGGTSSLPSEINISDLILSVLSSSPSKISMDEPHSSLITESSSPSKISTTEKEIDIPTISSIYKPSSISSLFSSLPFKMNVAEREIGVPMTSPQPTYSFSESNIAVKEKDAPTYLGSSPLPHGISIPDLISSVLISPSKIKTEKEIDI